MARTLRIDLPNGVHHCFDRGNEKKPIFIDDADRQRFMRMLAEMSDRFKLLIHAFVLMLNHYHLLSEAPDAGLSLGMKWLNGSYTQYFNKRHKRVGHLFQGRFKSVLVLDERYFVTVSRYIHLNPVKAGIVNKPWDFPWSSCGYLVGASPAPKWLQTKRTLDFFWGDPLAYRAFLKEGEDDVVSKAVAREISSPDPDDDMPDTSQLQLEAEAAALTIVGAPDCRSIVLYLLKSRGIKQTDLAVLYGISPAAVNKRISRISDHLRQDPKFAEAVLQAMSRFEG